MTIYEPLFLLLFLIAVVTAITGAVQYFRGRRTAAYRIFARLGVSTLLYLGIVSAAGFFSPQRILNVGDAWCFDDWCLAVEKVTQQPASTYIVSLRIFSRARRVAQRANGAWIYVFDEQGNRYAPQPDPQAIPLDALLQAGQSIATSRVFQLPAGVKAVGLRTGHGDWFGPHLIIGDDAALLHRRTYIRLQ